MNPFLTEIREQPEGLRRVRALYGGPGHELLGTLARLGQKRPLPTVVFSGMGSSLFAATPAMRYLSDRGVHATAIETSELLHYHVKGLPDDALLFLVSQSGETIEVERLLQRVPGRERLVAVTNVPGSTLGRAGFLTLPMEAGTQQVAVSSRAYHNTVAVLLLAAEALTGGQGLIDRLGPAAEGMWSLLADGESLGQALDEFLGAPATASVLARGPSLATAFAGALNLKEVARLAAEPMSAAQFRHGPIEVASSTHAAILFAPLGVTFTLLRKLSGELLGFGARVLFVTDSQETRDHHGDGLLVVRHPHLDETLAPLLNLIPIQLLANARAERLGLEPGQLSKASAVMRVE
jgi:glucosamine--fructose-6-phosphate aminotransferase (isomerizing)